MRPQIICEPLLHSARISARIFWAEDDEELLLLLTEWPIQYESVVSEGVRERSMVRPWLLSASDE